MKKQGEIYYKMSEKEYEELFDLIDKLEGYLKSNGIYEYDDIFKKIFYIMKGE